MLWDEIMQNCPTMKGIVEQKIAEEVGKKDIEIQQLKEEKIILAQNVLDLATVVEAMLLIGGDE